MVKGDDSAENIASVVSLTIPDRQGFSPYIDSIAKAIAKSIGLNVEPDKEIKILTDNATDSPTPPDCHEKRKSLLHQSLNMINTSVLGMVEDIRNFVDIVFSKTMKVLSTFEEFISKTGHMEGISGANTSACDLESRDEQSFHEGTTENVEMVLPIEITPTEEEIVSFEDMVEDEITKAYIEFLAKIKYRKTPKYIRR